MNYGGSQSTLSTVAYMRQVYSFLIGMFLIAGGMGFAVLKIAVNPASGVECLSLLLASLLLAGITYCLREAEGLNALCLVLFMGVVGWLGGALAIAYPLAVVDVYLSILVTMLALWLWSALSNQPLNFWRGFLWTTLTTLTVFGFVRLCVPYAKNSLLPLLIALPLITQLYLLGGSWSLTQKPRQGDVVDGAICLLFEHPEFFYYALDGANCLVQIIFSFFWWM